jgi:dTDP-glucose 4,6-dehydratase
VSAASTVLVTGGAGFIGSHVVDLLLERQDTRVVVLDALTYAGTEANLREHAGNERFRFEQGDVCDAERVRGLVGPGRQVDGIDVVIHAAAETHVDRSIQDSDAFIETNVRGTQVVLEGCRTWGVPLLFISTDEVYGSTAEGSFDEDSALRPNSPYAASKAAGELLCRAYRMTYGLEVKIVRGTNAYGPRQHREKAIPTFVLAALEGRPLPVYGDGSNRRQWLHVRDFARGVLAALDAGRSGETYNIGGGHEIANMELARRVCRLADADESLVTFVPDRPGHDFRYALEWSRLRGLGWAPEVDFDAGLEQTVAWYREWRSAGVAG